jgi:hypothetical protein
MSLKKELLLAGTVLIGSAGLAVHGTQEQQECLDAAIEAGAPTTTIRGVTGTEYEVIDDGRCLNVANTVGTVGVIGSVVGGVAAVYHDKRRRTA